MFTPTEAAGIVVVYALAVGIFVYRELPLRELGRFFADAALITSMALVIVIGASLFSWVVTRLGVSARLAEADPVKYHAASGRFDPKEGFPKPAPGKPTFTQVFGQ